MNSIIRGLENQKDLHTLCLSVASETDNSFSEIVTKILRHEKIRNFTLLDTKLSKKTIEDFELMFKRQKLTFLKLQYCFLDSEILEIFEKGAINRDHCE